MSWKISLRLTSEPEVLRIVRRLASAAARAEGASASDGADIEVAVGETLTNAHQHAYGGTPGPLEVLLEFDGLRFIVTISDDGEPVAAKPTVPGRLPPPGGGRGLYLIGQLMDDVSILPGPSGRRGIAVRMAKRLR